jgi:protein tyrosine phosphatase (PTP) superfamily phosphohydrolase (DUF442 family)
MLNEVASSNFGIGKDTGTEEGIAAHAEQDRPDISSGLFDPKAPLSHFDTIADGVYRSGRPLGEEGVKQAVEKSWGDSQFDPEHASHTTIIDLRFDEGKFHQSTEDQVNQEAQIEENLGINHHRIPMLTHGIQKPEAIQSALDYIDQRKAAGDRVLIHCYHGTDRTGTIAAAYELSHDPQLMQMVKNDPEKAFEAGLKSMTDNGFSPKLMPELTQSLQDYVNWKHDQLNGSGKQGSAGQEQLAIPSLWKAA